MQEGEAKAERLRQISFELQKLARADARASERALELLRERDQLRGYDRETTLNLLRDHAKRRKFVSYGGVAEANGLRWSQPVKSWTKTHLDGINAFAWANGWPPLSAIVVAKPHLSDGGMDPPTRAGFAEAVRRLGWTVDDPEAFLRARQEAVFRWAAGGA